MVTFFLLTGSAVDLEYLGTGSKSRWTQVFKMPTKIENFAVYYSNTIMSEEETMDSFKDRAINPVSSVPLVFKTIGERTLYKLKTDGLAWSINPSKGR